MLNEWTCVCIKQTKSFLFSLLSFFSSFKLWIIKEKMCFPVKCNLCGKTTWSGCGLHVDMVMRGVPPEQRCHCPRSDIHPPGPPQKSMAPPTDDVTKIANCCKPLESSARPPENADNALVKEVASTEEFKEELRKADNALVVVDFYANWCAPCKLMAPKVTIIK